MIYAKTELGKTAVQDKSLGLSPRQRSAFIMFDGKRSLDEVLKLTTGLGVTVDDIDLLQTLGLLAAAETGGADAQMQTMATQPSQATAPASAPDAPGMPLLPAHEQGVVANSQSQYAKAYLVAVRLTGGLGLRGFRLNLAVESAGDLEQLKDLAPKIKEAVGVAKFKELEDALYR